MSNCTYFVQECPTCGRRLQIRVEYLGKLVVCDHCRGRLVARDPTSSYGPRCETESAILRRAEELLRESGELSSDMGQSRPR
jgi:hypothetical protein